MQIHIDNLSHHYGIANRAQKRPALDGISLAINPGFNLLLGPNGAGKSTLFSLLTGLRQIQQGTINYQGRDLRSHRQEVMSQMGVVFQDNTLDLDLSVRQNLGYFASLHGLSIDKAFDNIEEVLLQLALHERLDEKVRHLNGGHKRRVEITRALIHKPTFLLFDEATVGLDLLSRKQILAFVRRYAAQQNATIVWATHLLEEVKRDDNLLLLAEGKLKGQGQCETLLQQHQVDTVADLFDLCLLGQD